MNFRSETSPTSSRMVVGVPTRRFLALVVAVACVSIATLVALSEWQDRQRRLSDSRREATNLARVLEEQTASMISAADLALLAIAESLRRDPVSREHDPVFEDSLRRLIEKVPAIRALFVIGPDGFIDQDSDRSTPQRNLADRDYFRAHAENPASDLFMGHPLLSRSVGTWFIGISRRVETPAGDFAGVTAAAVDAQYFESFYDQLGLGEGDVITLATRDSVLVARHPPADDRIGERIVPVDGQSKLEQALARGDGGSFEAVSTIDGTHRIFGFRAVPDHPLVVLVGLSRDRLLASWYWSAFTSAAATAAAFGIAFLLLWMTMRYAKREAAVQARAAEAANLEALGRLTSGVAHDFNNLLATMNAALRLLGKSVGHDARSTQIVEQGLNSVDRGRGLVAQLMGMARQQEPYTEVVDINAILAAMATLLQTAVAPKARIEMDLAPDLHNCRIDPSRLDAAVLNLVLNACDAMPDDESQGSICISTSNRPGGRQARGDQPAGPDGFVDVTVRDNGVGMTAEVRQRALEPFFSTKGEHGTGLGLSQVHEFVKQAGGEMEIDSKAGEGTVVRLRFPAT